MPAALLTDILAARRPARQVALFRIGTGLAVIGRGLKTARDLYLLQYDPVVVPAPLYSWAARPETPVAIAVLAGTFLVAGVTLTIGWHARLSALVACAISTWLFFVDQNFWGHHVYFMTLMLLLLAVTESDASLSVRWLTEGRPERDVAWWPAWLAQVQLSLAYLFTSIAKINPVFLSGEVMRRLVVPWPGMSSLAQPLALLALAAEFFLAFALWSRRLRPWAFVIGFGMHALIPIILTPYAGLVVFSLLVFSVYVLFLDVAPGSRLVVWDDTCGFCGRTIAWLRRLDWLAVHRVEGSSRPEALAEAGLSAADAADEITLRADGETTGGYDAIRRMLEVTPLGFLWAPALACPPLASVGRAVYRRVAARRHCLLPPR
jgi:predicted DCC family thiol-disulfide oxidoreductase YuxK